MSKSYEILKTYGDVQSKLSTSEVKINQLSCGLFIKYLVLCINYFTTNLQKGSKSKTKSLKTANNSDKRLKVWKGLTARGILPFWLLYPIGRYVFQTQAFRFKCNDLAVRCPRGRGSQDGAGPGTPGGVRGSDRPGPRLGKSSAISMLT